MIQDQYTLGQHRRRREWRDSLHRLNAAPRKVREVRRVTPTAGNVTFIFCVGVAFGYFLHIMCQAVKP